MHKSETTANRTTSGTRPVSGNERRAARAVQCVAGVKYMTALSLVRQAAGAIQLAGDASYNGALLKIRRVMEAGGDDALAWVETLSASSSAQRLG